MIYYKKFGIDSYMNEHGHLKSFLFFFFSFLLTVGPCLQMVSNTSPTLITLTKTSRFIFKKKCKRDMDVVTKI